MSDSPDPVRAILQRQQAEKQRADQEEAEAQKHRIRGEQLHSAFAAVKHFHPDKLRVTLGRAPTDDEAVGAWAKLLIDLGKELRDKADHLTCQPDQLAHDGDEAKAVAIEILRDALKGDTSKVARRLIDVGECPYRFHSQVSDWLRGDLENEIMGHRTLVVVGDDGKPRIVPDELQTGNKWQPWLSELVRGSETAATRGGAEGAEGARADQDQAGTGQAVLESLDSLAPSRQKALGQYLDAVRKFPQLDGASDREVYNWVVKHSDGDRLPNFDTWWRYLRQARRATGRNKNSSRSGRAGRSIVRRNQI